MIPQIPAKLVLLGLHQWLGTGGKKPRYVFLSLFPSWGIFITVHSNSGCSSHKAALSSAVPAPTLQLILWVQLLPGGHSTFPGSPWQLAVLPLKQTLLQVSSTCKRTQTLGSGNISSCYSPSSVVIAAVFCIWSSLGYLPSPCCFFSSSNNLRLASHIKLPLLNYLTCLLFS